MAIFDRNYLLKETLIGSFNLDELLLEDRINSDDDKINIKKVGSCNVYVYSGEGPKDHFHIKKDNIEICVRIYSAEFFSHDIHHSELSKSNCDRLNNWLKQRNILINPNKSNWEVIKDMWVRNNPNSNYENPPICCVEQPDYSNMKNTKGKKVY